MSLFSVLMSLIACTAKVGSDPVGVNLFPADQRSLRESSNAMDGSIDGQIWKLGKAIARLNSNGEYKVILAGENIEISCSQYLPLAPHISFVIPATKGKYLYDGSGGGRLVNVIFPYTTANGGGSDNILASKSQITIDNITDTKLEGSVDALSPENMEHRYVLSGRFSATICGSISGEKLIIKKSDQKAFQIIYSEALKKYGSDGKIKYEVRFMDKTPIKKCNTWSSWMMEETPINYLTIKTPAEVGHFDVYRSIIEYGYQTSSYGQDTDAFTGKASVKSLSNLELEVAIDARDYAGWNIHALGTEKVVICP